MYRYGFAQRGETDSRSAGSAFLILIAAYLGYIGLAYLAFDHGLRFLRTRRWLHRNGGQLQQLIDAYVEYELTSPSVHI